MNTLRSSLLLRSKLVAFLFVLSGFTGFSACALTVAVLPFDSKPMKKGEDQNLRDFEKLYYSYRLISALDAEKNVQAYFSPSATPATDIVVKGHINESNGRKTSVTLKVLRPDGREIDDDDYGILVSSRDFVAESDPAGKLWERCSQAIVQKAEKALPGNDAHILRVYGYDGTERSDDAPAPPAAKIAMADKASAIEIGTVLQPGTENILCDGKKLTGYYVTWQRKATPLVEQRSRDKVNFWLGELSIIGGAVAGSYSASHGYVNPGATASVAQGAFMLNMSSADMEQMNVSLSALKEQMSFGQGHEITVTFYDHVYHLYGNLSQQLAQFRAIVKSRLGGASGTTSVALLGRGPVHATA